MSEEKIVETSLARAFALHTDEQIAAYPQTARAHIKGLADLCEQKQSELSALREALTRYYEDAWALVEKWVTGDTRHEPDAPEGVFISEECAKAAVIGIKESFGEVAELHELEQALEQSHER